MFDLELLFALRRRYYRLSSELYCREEESGMDFDPTGYSDLISEWNDVLARIEQLCDAWNVGIVFDGTGWMEFTFA